ncbi:MAG: hypothetical protein P8129_23410 [Anaerolineae bacterium]
MSTVSLIHRILGETLLVIALAGVLLAIVGLLRKREMHRTERIFGLAYGGLLDLQALLGLAEFIWLLTLPGGGGLVTSTFILHPILMVSAIAIVHASRSRREGQPPTRHRAQLIAYGLSLALILGGYLIARFWSSSLAVP